LISKQGKTYCPACGCLDLKCEKEYPGKSSAFADAKILECMQCEILFAHPIPRDEELAAYNLNYFQSAHGVNSEDRLNNPFFSGLAKIRFSQILSFLDKNNIVVKKIIEVGPGFGEMAALWLNRFPDIKYLGIETDKSCHEHLGGLGVSVINNCAVHQGIANVDLIIMSHVLEHIEDPLQYLSKISESLREGGALFIEVPYRDFMYKKIVEPHLLFFNKVSLSKLLENVGFSVNEINYWGRDANSSQENFFFQKIQFFLGALSKIGVAPLIKLLLSEPRILDLPNERFAILLFKPHIKSALPAWWIRALAIKSRSMDKPRG